MSLPILDYQTIAGAHEALTKLGSARTCCAGQSVKDWRDQGHLDAARGFLGEAYADPALLRRARLSDAFHLMGIRDDGYKSACARLARIVDEAGKRPLTDDDLAFARDAFKFWSGVRTTLD